MKAQYYKLMIGNEIQLIQNIGYCQPVIDNKIKKIIGFIKDYNDYSIDVVAFSPIEIEEDSRNVVVFSEGLPELISQQFFSESLKKSSEETKQFWDKLEFDED